MVDRASVENLTRHQIEQLAHLWQRWFEEHGNPWEEVQGWLECFFCGCDEGEDHATDCIYVEVKRLLGIEDD